MMRETRTDAWARNLNDEDSAFAKRFFLASGSLKALAADYGVSYPTIRVRLDRLIAKVKLADQELPGGEFEQALRCQFIDGKIDMETFRELANAHRKDLEKINDEITHDPGITGSVGGRGRK